MLAALDLERVGDEQPAAKPSRGAWPFLELVDWIRADEDDIGRRGCSEEDPCKICRELNQADFGRSVSFSVLVKARTRLDIVCMLGARAIFSKERSVDVDVFVF